MIFRSSKNKTLWIFFSLAVLTVLIVILDFQHEKNKQKEKEKESTIITFPQEQIAQIEIYENKLGQNKDLKLRLKRTSEGWFIQEPIQELADQDLVKKFIDDLVKEKTSEKVSIDPDVDLTIFGLKEAKGSIVVINNINEKNEVQIATKKNYQGDVFIKKSDSNDVYLADREWYTRIGLSDFDFRDKKILKRPMAGIAELSVKNPKGDFKLSYQDSNWKSVDQSEWKLDQNKVRDVLGFYTNPIITEFTNKGTLTAEDLIKYGLNLPIAQMTLSFKKTSSTEAEKNLLDSYNWILSMDKEKHYFVFSKQSQQLLRIEAADAARILNVDLDVLRDRKLAFQFDQKLAHEIIFQSEIGTTRFVKEKSSWVLKEKASDEATPTPELVDNFLKKLSEIEVYEFASSLNSLPEKLTTKIAITDPEGKSLVVFNLANTSGTILAKKSKLKNKSTDRLVLIKSSLEKSAFYLLPASLKGLNIDYFFKKVETGAISNPNEGKR